MEKILPIRLLAMDVDGVLTRGDIVYSHSGDELKAFNCLDGCGIAVARHGGLMTAIVTARRSNMVQRRASEICVTHVVTGCRDKGAAIRELIRETGLTREEIAFIGDDLNDLLAFRACGWRVAVSNACADVKAEADHVTEKHGGQGAIRETIELILRTQGKWASAVEDYLKALESTDVAADTDNPAHQ